MKANFTRSIGRVVVAWVALFAWEAGAREVDLTISEVETPNPKTAKLREECLTRQAAALRADDSTLTQLYRKYRSVEAVASKSDQELLRLSADPEKLRKEQLEENRLHAKDQFRFEARLEETASASGDLGLLEVGDGSIRLRGEVSLAPCKPISRDRLQQALRAKIKALEDSIPARISAARAKEQAEAEAKRIAQAKLDEEARLAKEAAARERAEANLRASALRCAESLNAATPFDKLDLLGTVRDVRAYFPSIAPEVAVSACLERVSPNTRVANALSAMEEELDAIIAGLKSGASLKDAVDKGDAILKRFQALLAARASTDSHLGSFGSAEAHRLLSDFQFKLAQASVEDPVEQARLLGLAQKSVLSSHSQLKGIPAQERAQRFPDSLRRVTESDVNIAITLGRIPRLGPNNQFETPTSAEVVDLITAATARSRETGPVGIEKAQVNGLELDGFVSQARAEIGGDRAGFNGPGGLRSDQTQRLYALIDSAHADLRGLEKDPTLQNRTPEERKTLLAQSSLAIHRAEISMGDNAYRKRGEQGLIADIKNLSDSKSEQLALLQGVFDHHVGTIEAQRLIALGKASGIDVSGLIEKQEEVGTQFNRQISQSIPPDIRQKMGVPTFSELMNSENGTLGRDMNVFLGDLGRMGTASQELQLAEEKEKAGIKTDRTSAQLQESIEQKMIYADASWLRMKCSQASAVAREVQELQERGTFHSKPVKGTPQSNARRADVRTETFFEQNSKAPFGSFKSFSFKDCFSGDLSPIELNNVSAKLESEAADARSSREQKFLWAGFAVDVVLTVGTAGTGALVTKAASQVTKTAGEVLLKRAVIEAALKASAKTVGTAFGKSALRAGTKVASGFVTSTMTGLAGSELDALRDVAFTGMKEGEWDFKKLIPGDLSPTRLAMGALGAVTGHASDAGLKFMNAKVGKLWTAAAKTGTVLAKSEKFVTSLRKNAGALVMATTGRAGGRLYAAGKNIVAGTAADIAKGEFKSRVSSVAEGAVTGDFDKATAAIDLHKVASAAFKNAASKRISGVKGLLVKDAGSRIALNANKYGQDTQTEAEARALKESEEVAEKIKFAMLNPNSPESAATLEAIRGAERDEEALKKISLSPEEGVKFAECYAGETT